MLYIFLYLAKFGLYITAQIGEKIVIFLWNKRLNVFWNNDITVFQFEK